MPIGYVKDSLKVQLEINTENVFREARRWISQPWLSPRT